MADLNDQPAAAGDPSPAPATATSPAPDPGARADSVSEPPGEASALVLPSVTRRGGAIRRFAAAFLFGALAVLALSAGALAAFESSNAGRILPGVRVGPVDLSGLTRSQALARLDLAYAELADGELVLEANGTTRRVSFQALGRRVDSDLAVDRAMAVGRGGATIERIAANVRNVVRGVELDPVVTFEPAALRAVMERLAAEVAIAPIDASAALTGANVVVTPGRTGLVARSDAAVQEATALLMDVSGPGSIRVALPLEVLEPAVTTDEAAAARAAALRIAVDIVLVDGADTWTIAGDSIREWISFAPTADGGYGPVVAQAGLAAGLAGIAAEVARPPADASFLVGDGEQVVGVTEATVGRSLDVPGTVTSLDRLIEQRARGLTVTRVALSTSIVEPELTTAEATQTAPLMQPISEWTTYFPIGIKNGQGANIWIPARDINGYIVAPGAWFDFWEAIGPVTRERGYRDGGAIINGRTEPQGALAGGICSTSTTLFNAALRAGLEMGARRNHYYYIDRYPLGLDATVFQSNSGSVQTMSFRNDTEYPILIQGLGWNVGSKGYVKFVLWSVPNGRTVELSTPIVKNVQRASDSVEYTTELAPGVKERVEYPVDGKEVWTTWTVRDASGAVLHEKTYYSRYSRITGILRIGVAPDATSSPSPSLGS